MNPHPVLKHLVLAALWLCTWVPAATLRAETRERDAAATLVVYNANDPESEELARFYARERGIPRDKLVELKAPTKEEITRAEYETTIAEPLAKAFDRNGWWEREKRSGTLQVVANRIRYVVLVRGIPLKIAPPPLPTPPPAAPGASPPPAPTPVPFPDRTEASVDSELAALGFGAPSAKGAMRNPYFRSFLPIHDVNLPQLMLVARLDAPTANLVKRMILHALDAERDGLWGWAYVDGRGITTGGYAQGDEWMAAIAKAARDKGFPVIYDNKGPVFRNHYPLREAALYFGWYTEHPSGPFVRMDAGLKPGSIAVHLHSFSASTVRDPLRYWAGPLLASGAAATLGNVYEPYLDLTPHLDVFMERLFSGFTLGESAYASAKGLSWMTTVIGDPLYRPFAIFHDLARETPENVLHRPWKEYRDAALERKTDKPAGTRAIRAVAAKWRTGMPMEALAMLQFAEGRPELAFESLKEAGSLYVSPTDKLRVALHEIEYLIQRGRKQDALAVVRKLKPLYALGSDRQLLDALEKELDPPPAPTPSPTPFSPNSQPLPAR